MMGPADYSMIGLLGFVLIFFWQHLGRKYNLTWKPTYIIDLVTAQLVRIWTFLGKVCVKISAFYSWIDPSDLLATGYELFVSVSKFFFSWTYFITSYVSGMKLYDHPYLISLGSATLVGLISWICYTHSNWFSPLIQYCRHLFI